MGGQLHHPVSREEGDGGEGPRQVSYLVDAELPLEAAAHPIVQRDLHRVVDVPHFMPAHLILDVEPDHCRGTRREESRTPRETGTPHASTGWPGRAPSHPGAHSLGPQSRVTERRRKGRLEPE